MRSAISGETAFTVTPSLVGLGLIFRFRSIVTGLFRTVSKQFGAVRYNYCRLLFLPIADIGQVDLVAGPGGGDQVYQLIAILDWLAVDCGDGIFTL